MKNMLDIGQNHINRQALPQNKQEILLSVRQDLLENINDNQPNRNNPQRRTHLIWHIGINDRLQIVRTYNVNQGDQECRQNDIGNQATLLH